MTRVEKSEKAIQELSQRELATLRRWFERFDAAAWDFSPFAGGALYRGLEVTNPLTD